MPQAGVWASDVQQGLWRKGSASDSRSEGWEFESLCPHLHARVHGEVQASSTCGFAMPVNMRGVCRLHEWSRAGTSWYTACADQGFRDHMPLEVTQASAAASALDHDTGDLRVQCGGDAGEEGPRAGCGPTFTQLIQVWAKSKAL